MLIQPDDGGQRACPWNNTGTDGAHTMAPETVETAATEVSRR